MKQPIETNFTFRVDRHLKDNFISIAKQQDRNASLLFRDFMRSYLRDPKKLESSLRETLSEKPS